LFWGMKQRELWQNSERASITSQLAIELLSTQFLLAGIVFGA